MSSNTDLCLFNTAFRLTKSICVTMFTKLSDDIYVDELNVMFMLLTTDAFYSSSYIVEVTFEKLQKLM